VASNSLGSRAEHNTVSFYSRHFSHHALGEGSARILRPVHAQDVKAGA